MNTLPNIPIFGAKDSGLEIHNGFHEAMKRLMKDSTIPPFKQSLGTKYPAEFEESSELPVFADELDTARRNDSKLGLAIIGFLAFSAAIAAVKYAIS